MHTTITGKYLVDRRQLLNLGFTTAAIATAGGFSIREALGATDDTYARAFRLLDRYVHQYMREMNAPGLTLAIADGTGVQRVCAYGLDDLSRGHTLNPNAMFHIGSITKSFVGLCLLQLQEEGKVDLHRPITDYLPWLRFDPATRPITAHDLLTHSAALPDGPLFPADPSLRYRASAAPGTIFHYSNMGFEALGLLVASIDRRPLAQVIRERMLEPLDMTATEPVITLDISDRLATSYLFALTDRPSPRHGRLVEAPFIVHTSGAGCIASTARDMGKYLTVLINRGRMANGRLVSEGNFIQFTTPHIRSPEFGPESAYGYGIVVDRLGGHSRIRHTGGMVSFASALQVDLDAGVGAFASINAMQGYRPQPVAEYALRLMRACREGAALPDPPELGSPRSATGSSGFSGRYTAIDGRSIEIVTAGNELYLLHRATRVLLEPAVAVDNAFYVLHPDFAKYLLLFSRAGTDEKGPFVEAGWGEEWYVSSHYTGPREFTYPPEWRQYVGHYRNEDPWIGSNRVVARRGRLWLNGVVPLEAADDGRFYLRDEPASPDWIDFRDVTDGVAMRMRLAGSDLTRV